MGIPINGATRAAYDQTKTEATGSKPFPFISGKWTNYTAEVVSVETAIDQNGNGNDQILVKVRNGNYACNIYISLDPSLTGPNCTNIAEQIQKNLERLTKVGKCLDIINWKGSVMEIEPGFYPRAIGKIIEIGIQGAVNKDGSPKMNQKGYQVINTSFSGIAKTMISVVEPVGAATQPQVGKPLNDDIPF